MRIALRTLRYSILHDVRSVSNITTVAFDADDSLHVIKLWFSLLSFYCIPIPLSYYALRHVNHLCFTLSLVEGTHVQVVNVDAPEVTHIDATLSMLSMSTIHSSNLVRGT